MKGRADLYTPWRDSDEDVAARHVGRAEELDALCASIRAFADGDQPLPIYLFGPRGLGKSHLLKRASALTRGALEKAGLPLVHVSEDIPEMRNAEDLLARMSPQPDTPRWMRWREPPTVTGEDVRRVVFIEGLDRQLKALGAVQRKELRRRLGEQPVYLVGTGVVLPEYLTGKDEAFYGAFDPWPLEPLGDETAAQLLDRVTELDGEEWAGRRATLVTLAGGNSRALIALGRAFADDPQKWSTDALYEVLQQFTAHYQMRFRDLSGHAQQIVEVMAEANVELSPTDIAGATGLARNVATTLCGRLLDEGVLLRQSIGRSTLYRLAEPLFRYWLEYRNAPWEQTRIRMVGRLLEVILTPSERLQVWWDHSDTRLQEAAGLELSNDVVVEALKLAADALNAGEPATAIAHRLARFAPIDAFDLLPVAHRSVRAHDPIPLLELCALGPNIELFKEFVNAARAGSPRRAFTRLLESLHESADVSRSSSAKRIGADRFIAYRYVLNQFPHGRAWKLRPAERRRLAETPFVRVDGLTAGRLAGQPRLLQLTDLSPHSNWPDLELMVATALEENGPVGDRLFNAMAAADGFVLTPIAERARTRRCPPALLPVLQNATAISLDWLRLLLEPNRFPLAKVVERGDTRWYAGPLESDMLALSQLAFQQPEIFAQVRERIVGEALVQNRLGAAATIADLVRDDEHLQPELARLRDLLLQ